MRRSPESRFGCTTPGPGDRCSRPLDSRSPILPGSRRVASVQASWPPRTTTSCCRSLRALGRFSKHRSISSSAPIRRTDSCSGSESARRSRRSSAASGRRSRQRAKAGSRRPGCGGAPECCPSGLPSSLHRARNQRLRRGPTAGLSPRPSVRGDQVARGGPDVRGPPVGLAAQVGEHREHAAVILLAGGEVQLGEDARHVPLHGALAHEQLLRHAAQDFTLPLGQ